MTPKPGLTLYHLATMPADAREQWARDLYDTDDGGLEVCMWKPGEPTAWRALR